MTENTLASPSRRYWGVNLLPDVRGVHMSAFYLACLAGIMLATFVPQLQPFLLSEFLHIPQSEQGQVSGSIAFWGELAIIVAVGFWGSLSDKIGRRPVMAASFLIMAAAIILYPMAGSYHALLWVRVLFGIGVAAFSCMTFAIMADYAHDDSRGKATGYLGMANAFGALLTVFVLLRLPAIFQNQGMDSQQAGLLTYGIVAALGLASAVLLWIGLKPGRSALSSSDGSLLHIARKGLVAARDPGVALSYGAAFVSRGNLAIVGTFFTLWIANYGTTELGLSRADALAKAGIIVGIAQSCTLVGAPLFGLMSDRINRVDALAVTLAISALGYGGTYFVEDPLSGGMIFCAVLIGLGEVGCIITSGVLIAQQSPVAVRGAVMGFFNLCGAVGILVAAKLGGYLYDNWRESGPFVCYGIIAFLVLIWALLVSKRVVPAEER